MCITFQLMWSECNKKYTKNRLKEYVHTSDVCEQWKRFCLLWLFLLLILVSKTSVMYGGHNPHLKVYLELQQNDNSAVWLNEIKFKFRRWLIRLTQTQISLRQACKYKTRTMDFGLWIFSWPVWRRGMAIVSKAWFSVQMVSWQNHTFFRLTRPPVKVWVERIDAFKCFPFLSEWVL